MCQYIALTIIILMYSSKANKFILPLLLSPLSTFSLAVVCIILICQSVLSAQDIMYLCELDYRLNSSILLISK